VVAADTCCSAQAKTAHTTNVHMIDGWLTDVTPDLYSLWWAATLGPGDGDKDEDGGRTVSVRMYHRRVDRRT